jgi:hypothetical protein
MAYFDTSLPDTIDLTPGVKAFGDALTEVMKRKQQQKQFDEQMKFNREQEDRKFTQAQMNIDYQKNLANLKDRREQLDFNMRQNQHVATTKERARRAASPQESASILDDLRTYDPATGKETGRGKLTPGQLKGVGPEPTMDPKPELGPEVQDAVPDMLQMVPGMPPELAARLRGKARPQPTMGPFQTPEEQAAAEPAQRRFDADFAGYQADVRGGGDRLRAAQAAQDKFGAQSADYEDKLDAFPARQRAHQAAVRHAENTRPYTMSVGPNDPGTTFDFETQRHAAGKEAAERFLSSLPATVDAPTRQAAQVVAGYLASGTIKADQAGVALQKVLAQGVGEAGKDRRATAEIAKDIKVAEINSRKPGLVLQQMRFNASQDKDIRKETRKDVADWLKAAGLERAPMQLANMRQSLQQLRGNGKEQQAALVLMGRATQGDNRFSDKDYKVFVENGGVGALDSASSTIQQLIDGQYGDETIAIASQMANALHAVFKGRLSDAAADGREFFVNTEDYDPRIAENLLEQRLGKEFYRREGDRGGPRGGLAPPEVRAGQKAKAGTKTTVKVTGASGDQIDAALKALLAK